VLLFGRENALHFSAYENVNSESWQGIQILSEMYEKASDIPNSKLLSDPYMENI
jgi:hypothetical protein